MIILKVIGKAIYYVNKIFEHLVYIPVKRSMFASCGKNVYIGARCMITYNHVHVGNSVCIGPNSILMSSVSHIYIGNHVMFGPNVTVITGDHRYDVVGKYMDEISEKLPENDKDVIIEDDVWVGANVTILKGARIGTGSIIGAGSTVLKDIPPYTIHVGTYPVVEFPRWDNNKIKIHTQKMGRAI